MKSNKDLNNKLITSSELAKSIYEKYKYKEKKNK